MKLELQTHKCVHARCSKLVTGLACEEHQELAALMVNEFESGVPTLVIDIPPDHMAICENHLREPLPGFE